MDTERKPFHYDSLRFDLSGRLNRDGKLAGGTGLAYLFNDRTKRESRHGFAASPQYTCRQIGEPPLVRKPAFKLTLLFVSGVHGLRSSGIQTRF
jgi:hypothetical protein